MFDGIIEGINNVIRGMLFSPLKCVLNWLIDIVRIILEEISGFSFIDLEFVSTCYQTVLIIALVILPLKLIYEWIWLILGSDVEKWGTKVTAILQIMIILLLIPPIMTTVAGTVKEVNTSILSGDVISGSSGSTAKDAGKNFAATVLHATTSMTEKKAKKFIDEFNSSDFDINERNADDEYVYDIDFIMPMFMSVALWICIFFVGLQIASRQVSLAFFKIIMPICSLSLTNRENPTAFTVCKNQLIGGFLLNIVQIFLFMFMFKLLAQLPEDASGIAKLLFTIALILVIISIPNKIGAMIGGYNAGIMEGLQTIQSTMMLGSAAATAARFTGGAMLGAASMVKGGYHLAAKGKDFAKHLPGNAASKAGSMASRAGNIKDKVTAGMKSVSDAMSANGGVTGGGMQLAKQGIGKAGSGIRSAAGNAASNLKRDFTHGKREQDATYAFRNHDPDAVITRSGETPSTGTTSANERDNEHAQPGKNRFHEQNSRSSSPSQASTKPISDKEKRAQSRQEANRFERIPTGNAFNTRFHKQQDMKERRFK